MSRRVLAVQALGALLLMLVVSGLGGADGSDLHLDVVGAESVSASPLDRDTPPPPTSPDDGKSSPAPESADDSEPVIVGAKAGDPNPAPAPSVDPKSGTPPPPAPYEPGPAAAPETPEPAPVATSEAPAESSGSGAVDVSIGGAADPTVPPTTSAPSTTTTTTTAAPAPTTTGGPATTLPANERPPTVDPAPSTTAAPAPTSSTTTTVVTTTTTAAPTSTTVAPEPTVPTTTTTTPPAPTTTVPDPDDERRADFGRFLGYLWGDGNPHGEDFHGFVATTPAMAAEFERVAEPFVGIMRINPIPGTSLTKFRVEVLPEFRRSIPADGWTEGVPVGEYDLVSFATSVIEGEGGRNGLVYDDPLFAKRQGFAELLGEVGVETYFDRRNVFAERASWPVFDTWPFVTCSRVPGGRTC